MSILFILIVGAVAIFFWKKSGALQTQLRVRDVYVSDLKNENDELIQRTATIASEIERLKNEIENLLQKDVASSGEIENLPSNFTVTC